MNPFARFLRPPVYIGAGAVGAGAATLVVFNMLKWSLVLALLLILVIVMVAVILILLRQLKKAKQAEEIEKSVVVQADRDIERSVPGKQGEMKNLKAEFLAAVERLKTSKRGGKAVLSTLPWYMVVGPSEAGKSALLSQSGLQFALTDKGSKRGRSVKGVGGTKSFEWWLTQEAVLLDMTGRMVGAGGQFEDTGDWGDFLTVLRRQRPEKPLNGVIVVMPVDQLADRPDAQIEKQAGAIRDRIQEVIHHLGVVFPVYVVFTKCDLLAGFAEFFGSLGEGERDQPWGATFATDRAQTESSESLFDQEFGVLQAALADRRMARLPDVPDPLQRARAFAFPAQIERVRPALRRFLRVLFAEDASEKDQPLFRGFYFTSGEGPGTPVDRVLEPAARSLGTTLGAAAAPEMPPGAWFVHELLTGVVFEDAGLVTTSRGQADRQKMGRWLALGLLGVVLLAFVILFSSLSCVNGRLVGETRRAAERVSTSVRPDATLLDNLETLEELRSRVAIVDSLRHGVPWFRTLGAYSGHGLREPALDLYTRKTLEALIMPSYEAMQAELDTLTLRFSGEFADFYYTFRSWRLLATPGQLTPEDAPLITGVIQRLQAPRVRSMSQDVRDRVHVLIENQVEFLCEHPEYLEKRFFPPPNTYLLGRGKSLLAQRWESASFYRLLIDQVRRQTRALGVAALTDNSPLLTGTAEVPGPFTKEGYEKQVRPRIGWWRSQMARDGDLRDAFGGRTPDLAGDLANAYAADYAKSWVALLEGARGADAGGAPATVAENLRRLAGDDTPLMALLVRSSQQLEFAEDPASPLGRVQSSFAMLHEFSKAPPGGSFGRAASSAVRGLFKKKDDPLDRSGLASVRYLEQLRAAQREIADKARAGTDPQQYLALFALGGANAVQSTLAWLDQQASGFTEGPARAATVKLLRLPIQMCVPGGGALASGGGGIVPPNWNELVFMPFQKTLAGKYPFAAGGADASIADFTEFYRPGGTFWSYYEANMKSLVKEDGTSAGQTQVRSDIAEYVRHARIVRDAFFAETPTQPKLAFSVRTTTANIEGPQVFVLHMRLDVNGQFTRYSNGVPQWEALEWPGPDPTVGANLRVELAYGVTAESRSFPGPWGLFKLLDQAQWGGTPEAPRVTWRLSAGQSQVVMDYDVQPRGSAHPFHRQFFAVPLPQP